MKVLIIHGIGGKEKNSDWRCEWEKAVKKAITSHYLSIPVEELEFAYTLYDKVFQKYDFTKKNLSGVWDDLFRARQPRSRGSIPHIWDDILKMSLAWVSDDDLKKTLAEIVIEDVIKYKPDVILAHSLGSLMSYNAFDYWIKQSNFKKDLERKEALRIINKSFLITFGSQLGNKLVMQEFGGKINSIPTRHWFNLFNKHDNVLVAAIPPHNAIENFTQLSTHFDESWEPLNHLGEEYLARSENAWYFIGELHKAHRSISKTGVSPNLPLAKTKKKVAKKALLVGINEYPNPEDRLYGCENDVFLMSAFLQESGYEENNIRLLLNKRATSSAVKERLDWLMDGAGKGEQRIFFYSGHGTQVPSYGEKYELDHLDECLVTYDFDFDDPQGTSLVDDEFYKFYSQLNYNVDFRVIFDCCHSGGLDRAGTSRIRGISPPNDIRHRLMNWKADTEEWTPRTIEPYFEKNPYQEFCGKSGDTRRLGRSLPLRSYKGNKTYDALRKKYDHKGPYTPIILEACEEDSFSYEYQNGTSHYGAFTYHLVQKLRADRKNKKKSTIEQIIQSVNLSMQKKHYKQSAQFLLPSAKKKMGW